MFENLLRELRHLAHRLALSLGLAHETTGTDPVAEKLKGLTWAEDEDDESVRKMALGAKGRGDDLADAVFKGRPGNPMSDDF